MFSVSPLRLVANCVAAPLAKREMRTPTLGASWTGAPIWRDVAAIVAVSAFLTFTNPFGATADLPLWAGFLYWALLVTEGWFGGPLLGSALARLPWRFPALVNYAITTALVAVLVTATILLVQRAMGNPVPRSFWLTLYGLVLGISIGIAAVAWLVERAFDTKPGAVTHAPAAGAPSIKFLDRLPPRLKGGVLYAVESQDHYLRLHTSKGADLILMRLSDAIAELEGIEGAQTHRSWWVARDAVTGSRREGDRIVLQLKGGAEAPVSRPNVKPLREAGWF